MSSPLKMLASTRPNSCGNSGAATTRARRRCTNPGELVRSLLGFQRLPDMHNTDFVRYALHVLRNLEKLRAWFVYGLVRTRKSVYVRIRSGAFNIQCVRKGGGVTNRPHMKVYRKLCMHKPLLNGRGI